MRFEQPQLSMAYHPFLLQRPTDFSVSSLLTAAGGGAGGGAADGAGGDAGAPSSSSAAAAAAAAAAHHQYLAAAGCYPGTLLPKMAPPPPAAGAPLHDGGGRGAGGGGGGRPPPPPPSCHGATAACHPTRGRRRRRRPQSHARGQGAVGQVPQIGHRDGHHQVRQVLSHLRHLTLFPKYSCPSTCRRYRVHATAFTPCYAQVPPELRCWLCLVNDTTDAALLGSKRERVREREREQKNAAGRTNEREMFVGSRQGDGASVSDKGSDKRDVKHVYTEVDFAIGSQFIRHALDDSGPIADLQGNK
ncbi:hypothetical protein PR048_012257 [Dryococelus australis]|uniref:Uncharacterized protein n=1 Tax=Dryococelus australis TaxID=614101 RepID=A0ABQ9HNV1_9NEOP|nr:hypothetical protein PR048_012257 [Dryococelus australis]